MLTGRQGVYPLLPGAKLLQNAALILSGAGRQTDVHQPAFDNPPRAMADISFDVTSSIFAKTALGQQEIQSRTLGLPPLVRRLLILVDGKRSGGELAQYVPGQDIGPLLDHLIHHGCIDAPPSAKTVQPVPPAAAPVAPTVAATDHPDLAKLPNANQRSAKDIEMARNFMTNTINTIIGQYTRISLIKSIHACANATDLRRIYPAWLETMAGNSIGLKRLPELQDKLFKVL